MNTVNAYSYESAKDLADFIHANWDGLAVGGELVEQQLQTTIREQFSDSLDFEESESSSETVAQNYSWKPLFDTAGLKVGLLHLPAGGSIPAHDHPDTVGVSIVLKGSPELIQADQGNELQPRRKTLKAGDLSFIFPERNNIHGFENQDRPATLLSINISKSHRAASAKKWRFSLGLVDQLIHRPGKAAVHGLFGLSLCALSQASLAQHCDIKQATAMLSGNYVAEAVQMLDACAKKGDAAAQRQLADLYLAGNGVEQDHYEAAQWYRKAAEQGDAHSQYHYGVMLVEGQGITDDAHEGLEWLYQAMHAGHAEAKQAFEYLLANPEPLDC